VAGLEAELRRLITKGTAALDDVSADFTAELLAVAAAGVRTLQQQLVLDVQLSTGQSLAGPCRQCRRKGRYPFVLLPCALYASVDYCAAIRVPNFRFASDLFKYSIQSSAEAQEVDHVRTETSRRVSFS
jgi:hypothetical protein